MDNTILIIGIIIIAGFIGGYIFRRIRPNILSRLIIWIKKLPNPMLKLGREYGIFVGSVLLLVAFTILLIIVIAWLIPQEFHVDYALGISFLLGFASVGIGFIALQLSLRQGDMLENLLKIYPNYSYISDEVLLALVGTKVSPTKMKGQTKEEAQKRLDEDTRRTGRVRGKTYELSDKSGWGIAWGGEYEL